MNLEDRIREAIANELNMVTTDVSDEMVLYEGGYLEVVIAALEAEFNVAIDEEEELNIQTVGDLMKLVTEKVGEQA